MPVFIAALIGGLAQAAASLVGRVLLAMGFGYVSYTGVNTTITWLTNQIMSNLQGLSSDVLQFVALTKVDKAVAIISAAFLVRAMLNGLTSDTVKKLAMK